MQEQENAKTDPLHGLRVHSWVLVLSGKREVPESFFIDPFTARSYSTQDDHFLGIESLWNHKNYWVLYVSLGKWLLVFFQLAFLIHSEWNPKHSFNPIIRLAEKEN